MNPPRGYRDFQEMLRRRPPHTAVVLGSGLGAAADAAATLAEIDFRQAPLLVPPTTEGHAGRIRLAHWGGGDVLIFSGRLHLYEGTPREAVLGPVRLAVDAGVGRWISTNAAGGIRDDLAPGCFLLLTAHVDLTRSIPLDGRLQIARPYCTETLGALERAASRIGSAMARGVYAAVLGPNYETPAEIRALRALGCDAVGMSTANEVEFAHSQGLKCAALSCITNRAAGLGGRLDHAEVLECARRQTYRLARLLEQFLCAAALADACHTAEDAPARPRVSDAD